MLRRTSKRGQSGHRVDDNRDTVLKRIEGYLAETMPVVEYYRTQGSLINVICNNYLDILVYTGG